MMPRKPSAMARRSAGWLLCMAGFVAFGACAAPQTAPSTLQNNAQRMQRYYEQSQAPPPKQAVDPLHEEKPADNGHTKKSGTAGAEFVLKSVQFSPTQLLDPQQLQAVVKSYIGKRVTYADLGDMLDAVNALYKARHINTAKALLPNQDIVDGVLHVELVEGRLGKITVQGNKHIRTQFILRRIRQQPGQVVDSDRLRKSLVYLNQTTDLQVRALLAPGAKRGQTDIRLAVQEPDRHTFDIFTDNGGVDSTGRYRLGAQGHIYGLFGVDDALDGNIAHSKGGNDGAVSYSVPLFSNNGRIGVTLAYSQINIIDRAFRDLDITGTSSVKSLNYKQPFIATLNTQFSGIAAYSISDSTTNISGKQIAKASNHSATLGLSLDHTSKGRRWSITQLVTRLQSDEPMLGKSSFNLIPGSAFLIQRLGSSHWAVRGSAGWQFTSGKIVPSANLFQIGGPGSVRGYERGVLAGPRGYYASLELHRTIGEHLDLYGFADHGEVRANYPKASSITGTGLGVIYRHRWFSMSADVAKPLDTKVTPAQDSMRFDFRLNAHFD